MKVKKAVKGKKTEKSSIAKEVEVLVQNKIDKHQVVKVAWVTKEVVLKHDGIRGVDREWYQVCAYAHVRDVVGEVARRYKVTPKEESDTQILLPGFERLQVAYTITRGEESQIVPVDMLTHEERKAKSAELRRMGSGCFLHADEMDRYDQERGANGAVG